MKPKAKSTNTSVRTAHICVCVHITVYNWHITKQQQQLLQQQHCLRPFIRDNPGKGVPEKKHSPTPTYHDH